MTNSLLMLSYWVALEVRSQLRSPFSPRNYISLPNRATFELILSRCR
ncbi:MULTISPECIES: hypothetical protein [unclassified Microcoleus]